MRKTFFLGPLVALGLAGTAVAQDSKQSYSYFEANYLMTNLSDTGDLGINDYGDGLTLEASIGMPRFHVFLSYYGDDHSEFNQKVEFTEIGFGSVLAHSARADLVTRLAYVGGKADFGAAGEADSSGDGIRFDLAVRGHLTDRLEMELGSRYRDVEGIWDETVFNLDTRYFFTRNFGIQAGVQLGNEIVAYTVGVRFNFNPFAQ